MIEKVEDLTTQAIDMATCSEKPDAEKGAELEQKIGECVEEARQEEMTDSQVDKLQQLESANDELADRLHSDR